MEIIAYIETDFPEKFGIPRQSGLVKDLTGRIVFEPKYRQPDAVKGLEGFNYLWLLWEFEGVKRENWSATVKPPRLGGNTRMGVFATRSPYRPNPIGLSSVKLLKIEIEDAGPVLYVSGIDLKDKTPIYDIKPYLPYVDCHTDALDGFAGDVKDDCLEVEFPKELLCLYPEEKQAAAIEILKQDPRPSYQDDSDRRYGVSYAGYDIHFYVKDNKLTVVNLVPLKKQGK